MVHVERNPPESLRNGRSRGPSPNGHGGSPDSSDDDSTKNNKGNNKAAKAKSEYEEKIRVGKDYQTICPDLIPPQERKLETLNDRALLVWSPTKDIPDNKLEEYITVAKERYGYNGEQALGMLFWHKHDLERAVMDLANFTPFPDEWTEEDKVLFEQAFHFHGKSFHRIRQMLPDKNIASLVKYYYSWKKTRSRTSVMDRQEKNKIKEGSENGSENGSNEDSDTEDKKWPLHRGIRRASRSPPPRTSDDSSNSVSSSAIKQANNSPNTNPTNSNSNNGNALNTATINGSSSSANTKDATNLIGGGESAKGSGGIQGNATSTGNISTNNSNSAILIAVATSGANNATQTQSSSVGGSGLDNSLNASNQLKECFGCGVPCNQTNTSPHGALCNSCYHHWSRTGTLRPTSGPGYGKRSRNNANNNGLERHKSKLPRGMYINHDDIVTLATQDNNGVGGGQGRNDDLLASMDREMSSLLSQIQNNKQIVSSLKNKSSNYADVLYPNDSNGGGGSSTSGTNRINSRWNNDELQLAMKGVRKHGKDFQAIAEILGTKTETQVRTFYVNYRRKYNLDAIVRDYEARTAAAAQQIEEKQQPQLKEQQPQQQTLQKPNDTQQNNKQLSSKVGAITSTILTAAAPPTVSATTTTTINANTTQLYDAKNDGDKSKASDDDIMEIDLVDDIPNNKEDEDMEDVTIIEEDSSSATTIQSKQSTNGIATPSTNFSGSATEPIDSTISISTITSSTNNSVSIVAATNNTQDMQHQQQHREQSPHQVTITQSTPSLSLSAAATSQSSTPTLVSISSAVNATVTSTSPALVAIVEPAKATAI